MANHIFSSFILRFLPLFVIGVSLMNSQTIPVEARQLLEVTLPEFPKLPSLPEFPKPELPEFEVPKLPELPPFLHFPDLSKTTLPAIPRGHQPISLSY
ncbi:hypothetical protein OIU85_007254 [Salix viminalis]|uniref:Uncharacterized protein n=1 Tax=Salix viminalis TaxID=40686 RepID=A0A9Q0P971_SALVM|nr:hypothetical protein OIU85_007254 [Salix viminalis]